MSFGRAARHDASCGGDRNRFRVGHRWSRHRRLKLHIEIAGGLGRRWTFRRFRRGMADCNRLSRRRRRFGGAGGRRRDDHRRRRRTLPPLGQLLNRRHHHRRRSPTLVIARRGRKWKGVRRRRRQRRHRRPTSIRHAREDGRSGVGDGVDVHVGGFLADRLRRFRREDDLFAASEIAHDGASARLALSGDAGRPSGGG